MTPTSQTASNAAVARTANIVGLGLIGGSVAQALRASGFTVYGTDIDMARQAKAIETGIIHHAGLLPDASISFVCTSAGVAVDALRDTLAKTSGIVTDVCSVKAAVCAPFAADPRFVGGHPMAGSEQEGLDGARADMFAGTTWVLTPTLATPDATFAFVRSIVAKFGAEVISLPPDRHDALVAVVSHVPHLVAAGLMSVADGRADEHAALLQLAAGGFRDMTRIASGHPAIWPDICEQNRDAIVSGLDSLVAELTAVRDIVATTDRAALVLRLERARDARRNLPPRVATLGDLAEVRIPIPDRPGMLAEITTLASRLGVSIADIEIMHSAEGNKGVCMVLIDATAVELYRGGLIALGYSPSAQRLG